MIEGYVCHQQIACNEEESINGAIGLPQKVVRF